MEKELIGYADRMSVAPGETVAFKISTDFDRYEAAIVRLIHGDSNGPGFKERVISPQRIHQGRKQRAHAGSYGLIADHAELAPRGGFTLQMWIFPTTPAKGEPQGLLSKWSRENGYALVLGARGDVCLWLGDGRHKATISTGRPVRQRQWYFVSAAYDPKSKSVSLRQVPLAAWANDESGVSIEASVDLESVVHTPGPLLMGATHIEPHQDELAGAAGLYNGKIDRPVMLRRALCNAESDLLLGGSTARDAFARDVIAAWDLSIDIHGRKLVDAGPQGLHGVAVNMPTRAVTGHNWSGSEADFKHAPDQYEAIHFHDDDLEDARWLTDFEWQVPAGAPSGFYAARIRSGQHEDHIPFFVRPPRASSAAASSPAPARALVLVPTMTYLAYASYSNWAFAQQQAFYTKRVMVKDPLDHYLAGHPEFGLSLYDTHRDGSGCCFSSHLRPIVNMRPKYRWWQFDSPRHLAADLYLIDWLEEKGIAYDLITDHDLHFEGGELLGRYSVVLTGTHPEYWTAPMRNAVDGYLRKGGSQMYLGGNGYYWVTSVDPERPHAVEVRRGVAGSRPWNSAPGEAYHSSTGELGGLWRHRGRPPNEITGVGFKAMGYDSPVPGYRRQAGSFDARVAFIFEGVGAEEIIGDFGLVLGGAAGDEIDCFDYDLGTPPHALRLATASGFTSYYEAVVEDHKEMSGVALSEQRRLVRADMVYFETGRGGAVFSVGAISWCGSLSHNNYDNNVSRITENVLRRLIS